MSSEGAPVAAAPAAGDVKPKKKMCCACPDTKRLRDDCVIRNGEEACKDAIQAHIQCLRSEGFNV
jgi:cytochrome c oxidase assembly protein subunit 17